MTHPDGLTIADYVDDALEASSEREAIDAHLHACSACRALADECRAIRAAAAALPPLTPPAAAWTRIEGAIRAEAAPRRPSHMAWSWLAAAAALLIVTVVGARWWLPARGTPSTSAAVGDSSADIAQVQAELLQAEQHYQNAINLLEGIARASEGALDAQTVAELERNLMAVDLAIGESRAALKADPTSTSAQRSLLDGYKAKLAVLEDAVALIDHAREDQDTARRPPTRS